MKKIKFKLIRVICRCLFFILGCFVKIDNNLILFGSASEKFSDNPKYLFLYFYKKNIFNIYWVTSNKMTYNYLLKNKYPVLFQHHLKTFFTF